MSPVANSAPEKRRARWPVRTGFAADARGVAIIEFAYCLPVMVMVLGLATILGQALAIAQKVTDTSRTIVDIISRNNVLSTSQMQTILNASGYTMTPYSDSNLSIVAAEIVVDGSGNATVKWSAAAYNGVALTQGSAWTLPVASMAVPNATYIYGQVSYSYTPIALGFGLSKSFTLTDSAYFTPRISSAINYPYPS